MTVTTALLSQLALTVVPFHYLPQRAQAIAIGASSLIAIYSCWMACGHWNWIQSEFQKAPVPHAPEASLHSSWSGWLKACCRRMDMLFQDSMNMCHHLMSDLASLLIIVMLRCLHFASVRREISLPMNDLPGLTTLQAWLRRPRSDSSFYLEHTFLNCHSDRSSLRLLCFSCGSLSSMAIVSISIPRKTRQVEGPTHLCDANETPNSVQVS